MPELGAALAGVTEVELFLAGEGVRRGVSRDELVADALQQGVSVVLPSGVGLSAVARAGPAKF